MTKTSLLPISKTDTHIFKGIGILIIMFHNFLHWVEPNTGENEFEFVASRVVNLLKGIIHTPSESFNLFFDFFGPYGLVFFFFLSAYGLTISYHKKENISYLNFMKSRFIKLYPSFILSAFLLILWFVVRGEQLSFNFFRSIFYKLLLISNFIKNEPLAVNGPWWFFVAIMQFYFVFPLIMKGQKKYGNKFLLIVASVGFIVRFVYVFFNIEKLFFIPYTFIPYLFELSLGIYLASIKEINFSKSKLILIVVISFLIFLIGNYVLEFWFFASAAFLILFLFSYSYIREMLIRVPFLNKFLIFFGSMSYYLYLVHGPLRVPLTYYTQKASAWSKIGYLLVFIILSIIFALFLKWLEERVISWLKKKFHRV